MPGAADNLIFVSRLSKSEKGDLYKFDKGFPNVNLGAALRDAAEDVVVDRLILSEGFLRAARRLVSRGAGEEDLRAAVSRAYYAVHHAARVLILKEEGYEADGHEAAIKDLKRLLGKPDFQRRCGLSETVIGEIAEAKNNRSVADYSPYRSSRKENGSDLISITGGDWRKAAAFNIALAEKVFKAAY